jgi:hypothetical protein
MNPTNADGAAGPEDHCHDGWIVGSVQSRAQLDRVRCP